MWEQITSNRVKSIVLVVFFVAFVIFLGWIFGETTVWGPYAPVLAAIIAGVGAIVSYYKSDQIVLAISKARPADEVAVPAPLQLRRGPRHRGRAAQARALRHR